MKLRYILFAAALLSLATLPALGQGLPKANVVNSTHDINGSGCKGCHAPHNGSSGVTGGSASTGNIQLWAQKFPDPTKPFGVYDSPTLQTKALELANNTSLTLGTDVRMYSLLCLSCHDGVTSTITFLNQANVIGSLANSTGLTNDHPVNIKYDNVANKSLQDPQTVSAVLPLYTGTNGTNTVQCATCHDPHDTKTYTNYLRQPNDGAHCTTCHK